jgi:class 3 adenylate cyclase
MGAVEPGISSNKYLYLDVVGFTRERSVETQAVIVAALNAVVRDALRESEIPERARILLPTGDGMCIALLEGSGPFDVHVRLALSILNLLRLSNEREELPARRFEVRIGLNENVDNVVEDINGNPNVAGAGVNDANRIMMLADGGQVLVGSTVHEHLRSREAYMRAFRAYEATVKHDVPLKAYQLILDRPGLSVDVPRAFAPKPWKERRLSRVAALYVAEAVRNRGVIVAAGVPEAASTVWLWLRALDRADVEKRRDYRHPVPRMPAEAGMSPGGELAYYARQDAHVVAELADSIGSELSEYEACFEESDEGTVWVFVSERGREKLCAEYPDLLAGLGDPGTE